MAAAPDPSFDALLPADMAAKVVQVGVNKAALPLRRLVPLGVLAGAFIGLGANFSTVITADTALSPGIARLLGGLVFSLGLVLVVVSGAELFTGNNLLVMAWVSRRITTGKLLENLAVVFVANFIGAAGLATGMDGLTMIWRRLRPVPLDQTDVQGFTGRWLLPITFVWVSLVDVASLATSFWRHYQWWVG